MYFTSGSDRAFEQLMQQRPGADHFDSGDAGAPEDCGDCRFYRPDWKYQFCSFFRCTAIWLRFFPPINRRKIKRTTSAASSSIIQKSLLSGSLT